MVKHGGRKSSQEQALEAFHRRGLKRDVPWRPLTREVSNDIANRGIAKGYRSTRYSIDARWGPTESIEFGNMGILRVHPLWAHMVDKFTDIFRQRASFFFHLVKKKLGKLNVIIVIVIWGEKSRI